MRNKGITLVALIITMIVLLILAGITITLTTANNGIIHISRKAKQEHEISETIDKLELEKIDLITKKEGAIPSVQEYINYLITREIIKETNIKEIDQNHKYITVEKHTFLIQKETNGNIKITYHEGITKVYYEAKEIKDKQITVLITVENSKGIEKITLENFIIECKGKTKVTFDRTLEEGNEYEVKVKIKEKEEEETHKLKIELPPPPPPTAEEGEALHTAKALNYTWEELGEIAKIISDNDDKITRNTAEVAITMNRKEYTLGIGDWTTVNGKTVRILGFNHDELSIIKKTDEQGNEIEINQYGEGQTNTKAGISFEFVNSILISEMNSTKTSLGGWKVCSLRDNLNDTISLTLENAKQIKRVRKEYIPNGKQATTDFCDDYLWLLSRSEMKSQTEAVISDGKVYKLYAMGQSLWKCSEGWWSRTAKSNQTFIAITDNTGYGNWYADKKIGVAPGFAI